ncbi:MAG: homoserine O-acetyltransferase, partial [Actinomyces graevenitzii]|nr:homoserine O-acetyltransferase [Actinomyces graevenitzii]
MNRNRQLPPAPVSGAWKITDPRACRRFANVGDLRLENDSILPAITLAYETWGELNEDRSNAILIEHALTGDAHVIGEAEPGQPTAGWWSQVVGPDLAIDTNRYFMVAINVLGGCQGST